MVLARLVQAVDAKADVFGIAQIGAVDGVRGPLPIWAVYGGFERFEAAVFNKSHGAGGGFGCGSSFGGAVEDRARVRAEEERGLAEAYRYIGGLVTEIVIGLYLGQLV